MLRTIVLVLISLTMTACVSTKTIVISEPDSAQLDQSSLTTTKRDKPDFSAVTAGKAVVGGLIGAMAMIAAGNNIVEEHDIADPADYITKQLAEELATHYGVNVQASEAGELESESPQKISKQHDGVDYVLDVRTVNWSFAYFPSDWNNYRVIHNARMRLIDTETGDVIAQGFCSRIPEKTSTAPSKDELLAENAARLKQELQIAADECIENLKANVFHI